MGQEHPPQKQIQGWVKLHRVLLDKSIWRESTPQQKVILITLLLMANHRETQQDWNGKKIKVRPGQFVTSIEAIKNLAGYGISEQNVRSALKKFENCGFLTSQSAKSWGRLITIINWQAYQHQEPGASLARRRKGKEEVFFDPFLHSREAEAEQEFRDRILEDFDEWWKDFPRKERKKEAETKYIALRLKGVSKERLEESKQNYLRYVSEAGTGVMLGKALLNSWQEWHRVDDGGLREDDGGNNGE